MIDDLEEFKVFALNSSLSPLPLYLKNLFVTIAP